jgi:hypothetical protein
MIALFLAGTIMAGVFIRWAVIEDRKECVIDGLEMAQ